MKPRRRLASHGGCSAACRGAPSVGSGAARTLWPFAVGLVPFLLLSCGYHLASRSTLIPRHVKTIAIPAFANATTRYQLAQQLSADLTREFIARTRYRIVADPNAADAVLEGSVIQYMGYPVVFDPVTSRASTIQVHVILSVALRDRSSGAVLFTDPGLEIRERYELSVDQRAYLEESDPALRRASREAARRIVSSLLEGF